MAKTSPADAATGRAYATRPADRYEAFAVESAGRVYRWIGTNARGEHEYRRDDGAPCSQRGRSFVPRDGDEPEPGRAEGH